MAMTSLVGRALNLMDARRPEIGNLDDGLPGV
jgi:hypothetical protein